MDIHKNVRLSFRSREDLARFVIQQGATRKAAAAAFRVSPKTAAKWVSRFQASGATGLLDHSSRPHRSPRRLSESLSLLVVELRRTHMPGYEIARRIGASPASVSRILRRARLTDNSSSYRSGLFRLACQQMQLKPRHPRPYTPRTNDKAELHPDRPARMGLRSTLDGLRATRCLPQPLDRLLQPPATSC